MLSCFTTDKQNAIALTAVAQNNFDTWLSHQSNVIQNWIASNHVIDNDTAICLIPNHLGQLDKVLIRYQDPDDYWQFAKLINALPKGSYFLEDELDFKRFAYVWGLGCYQFDLYKKSDKQFPQLFIPQEFKYQSLHNLLTSIYWVRDLINTPAEDMGPYQLLDAAKQLSKEFKGKLKHIAGDSLLKENYPAIHAVGRSSSNEPQLIDLTWGNKKHPKLTLVGKGVCFDSGGLNVKPDRGMRLMKKDMGGAAHVLGLANLIMAERLPVHLRVLIPAVENLISSNSYKPGDIINTRSGKTVEIGHTDAEGRVILADALTEACNDKPDLLIDFATLTGAARVALGTDIPILFSNQQTLADELLSSATKTHDPIWQLPLYKPYFELIKTPFADLSNNPSSGYGGAITAALFLQEFVSSDTHWAHFDLMGYNLKAKPGRPEGGEAMGLTAVFHYLQKRYG